MNKTLRKAGILAAIFVVALLVFFKTINHESEDLTADMEAAGLPVVYMLHDAVRLSELHGYVDEMEATSMVDNVTVVPEDNTLSLQIDTYGNEINSISYQVRSGDGQRLIEDGQAVEATALEGAITAQLPLQDLLSVESEYLLILQVDYEDTPLQYYTKLVKYEGYDTDECIDFVVDFHEKTLNKEEATALSTYLEPSADADNTNLQHVSIQNRLRQIYWDQMEVTEVTAPIVTVSEANEDYNVILLTTTVSAPNENGTIDYYNVKEYYRVRQGIERMYLLDYQREVEEIFQGDAGDVQGSYIQLGIRSEDVDYWSNETGTNVCFVQQGDLWSYNQNTNQLVDVYSFRSYDAHDVRENYDQHDIRIISADETGSIEFIVYGYMNRGEHEGQVGISVCHYDSVTNTVEEWLFMPTSVSYQVMSQSISQLLYINDDGVFYLMLGVGIYAINLETKEYEIFLDNLVEGTCQVSADGRYVAWVDAVVGSSIMHVADLNTGKTIEVEAPAGSVLKPMGFMESDVIYGCAPEVTEDLEEFHATSLKIGEISETGLVELTSYEKSGYWIKEVVVDRGLIKMSLALNGETESSLDDTITNKEVQESKKVQVETYTSELKQTQVRLSMAPETAPEKEPMLKTPKLMLSEEPTTLKLDENVFLN